MARSRFRKFTEDQSGAVAATYALALIGLIAIAGVGFDYGRLASMDSELQNGADQAALAGATQLDGKADACARAASAAIGLVTNSTILASDSHTISIPDESACDATGSVRFWQDKDRTTAATSGANAHFIELTVDVRTADYALTPVTGLFKGSLDASAMAGLGSSICKVPPVFMCNPLESSDPSFTVANYIGKGVRLIANDGGGSYGPGNFGYLQTNAGNGAQAVAQTLGRVNVPGDCIGVDDVATKPGVQISVLDALNSRFDVYANGLNNACGSTNGLCPPSANSRKDLMQKGNNCNFATGNGAGWKEAPHPYLPTSATTPLTSAQIATLSPMGYPRDMCHAVSNTGSCSGGQIGDGNWDRNAYFKTNTANYPSNFDISGTFGTSTPTRYQVYKYEAANPSTRLLTQTDSGTTSRPTPVCVTPGVPVASTQPDRRVLSVAVIDCVAEGVQGQTTGVNVTKWIDVFLVEPSVPRARTEASDVYVEVIGETKLGGGGSTSAQLIRRDVPYLVR